MDDATVPSNTTVPSNATVPPAATVPPDPSEPSESREATAPAPSAASRAASASGVTSPRGRSHWRPGLGPLAGLLASLSALLQILTSPVLGLADNGDYKRVLNHLDLVAVRPPGQSHFQFLVLDYVSGPAPEQSYTSTELFFVGAVRWLHDLLGFGPN